MYQFEFWGIFYETRPLLQKWVLDACVRQEERLGLTTQTEIALGLNHIGVDALSVDSASHNR